MAKSQRKYSDEARAASLAVLVANDGNVKRTAREVGVPASTLKRWRDDPEMAGGATLRAQTRETMADVFGRVAARGAELLGGALDLLTAESVAADPKLMNAVNTVTGTAADKETRLRGEPTEHVKQTARVEVVVRREDRPIRASD